MCANTTQLQVTDNRAAWQQTVHVDYKNTNILINYIIQERLGPGLDSVMYLLGGVRSPIIRRSPTLAGEERGNGTLNGNLFHDGWLPGYSRPRGQ